MASAQHTACDVGTLEWARRTSGRLTSRQLVAFAAAQIGQQLRQWTERTKADGLETARTEMPWPDLPDGDLAAELTAHLGDALPEPLVAHSCRVWIWAHALLAGRMVVDPNLLLAACLMHDAGLAKDRSAGDTRCFTVRSAERATAVLDRIGFGTHDTDLVAAAIIGHMNATAPPDAHPLTIVLVAATRLDVTGHGTRGLPSALVDRAHREFPRDGFPAAFTAALWRELRHAPRTRAAATVAIGLPLALRLNPLERRARHTRPGRGDRR